MGRIQDLSGTPLSSSGCLSNGFHAFSTPRIAAPSRYTSVLRAAHGRVFTLHSTLVPYYVHELGSWTLGFRLFCVDRFSRRNSSLSTLKQTNVSPHTHWLHERKKPNRFYSETIVLLHTSRSFPSIWLHSCHNKLLFHTLPLWWHTSRCLKSPLKRVFHVLRSEQSLRSFFAPLQSFLGQSGLTRSNLSVSQIPCTAF